MNSERGNWPPVNTGAILANVNKVFEMKNINQLNKPTYLFLKNLDGFIAHYDIEGFKSYYTDLRELIHDLNPDFLTKDAQRGETNKDFGAFYGKTHNVSVAETKRGLAALSMEYKAEINAHFGKAERAEAVETVKRLVEKYHIRTGEL